jgi:protein-S-isoprenylcysteine O-methyltransferase Ste14
MTQAHENAPAARDHANVRFFPPLAYVAPMAAGLAMHFAFSDRFLPQGWVQLAAGLPLIVASVLLAAWGSMTMRRAGTTVDASSPTTAIVVRGPFRFSRNPLYLSLTVLYLGIAVLANALWVMALLPIALVSITVGVIAREESYLERKFGTEYISYKSRVRRWL